MSEKMGVLRDRVKINNELDHLYPTQRHLDLSLWYCQHFVLRLIQEAGRAERG